MKEEFVILVDEKDVPIGKMEKMEAHRTGALHRAFSVFLFNDNNELLLHKRADSKYHSPGLWTNTCCSHPRINEPTPFAAHRRLFEEMGIRCELDYAFSFLYKEQAGELIEHEMDHVFIGRFNGDPEIDRNEVADWKYLSLESISNEIKVNPDQFTIWFRIIFKDVFDYLENGNNPFLYQVKYHKAV